MPDKEDFDFRLKERRKAARPAVVIFALLVGMSVAVMVGKAMGW